MVTLAIVNPIFFNLTIFVITPNQSARLMSPVRSLGDDAIVEVVDGP
jgi:hypothetical protein